MVKIISDSTCDLSPELIAKYDIDILPLHILLGEDEYEDGKNIMFVVSNNEKIQKPKKSAKKKIPAPVIELDKYRKK